MHNTSFTRYIFPTIDKVLGTTLKSMETLNHKYNSQFEIDLLLKRVQFTSTTIIRGWEGGLVIDDQCICTTLFSAMIVKNRSKQGIQENFWSFLLIKRK